MELDYAATALGAAGLGGGSAAELTDIGRLGRYWARTVWAAPDGRLRDAFCRTVSGFAADRRADVAGYLAGDIRFDDIVRIFIECLPEYAGALDPVRCRAELQPGARAVTATVDATLSGCALPREPLRILGYGADSSEFEYDIARVHGASGHRIHRFDPYASPRADIIDLDAAQLNRLSDDLDLVTARWVLHHVEPAQRWAPLIACLSGLADGGHFVLVEQGDFADRDDPRRPRRLYRLLTAAIDAIANYGMRPSWFTDNGPDFGAAFHVDYLDATDLRTIESGFSGHRVRRTVYPIRDGERCGETVIVYHLGH
ncbi:MULTISPECIES: hypothetical protein [unclassified Nocardia]|uniref:hypothetical protein n=1 Tax=unclassified Nocardia TaxID=2637762 RepID=UPI001CE48982|nr:MULTISPECIES: hypothetical protein [unclassified Nocardia]